MVYSTRYDKNADRQIPDRTDRPPPDLFVPGRDFRYRSGIQQYRGMVVVDSRRRPAAQGSTVLSSARREFRIGIRRLRFRAKSVARRVGRADPAFASRGDFRKGQIRRLSPAQSVAELERFPAKACPYVMRAGSRFAGLRQQKRRPDRAPFVCRKLAWSLLLRSRVGRGSAAGWLVRFELLACLFGAFLQLFLQLLLGFLEHLRIGRRPIIGLGEIRQREGQGEGRGVV